MSTGYAILLIVTLAQISALLHLLYKHWRREVWDVSEFQLFIESIILIGLVNALLVSLGVWLVGG